MMIEKIDLYWGIILNGIITGFSVAIGSYLANAHIIERVKKLNKKFRKEITWFRREYKKECDKQDAKEKNEAKLHKL